jgi:hypothetical protein
VVNRIGVSIEPEQTIPPQGTARPAPWGRRLDCAAAPLLGPTASGPLACRRPTRPQPAPGTRLDGPGAAADNEDRTPQWGRPSTRSLGWPRYSSARLRLALSRLGKFEEIMARRILGGLTRQRDLAKDTTRI